MLDLEVYVLCVYFSAFLLLASYILYRLFRMAIILRSSYFNVLHKYFTVEIFVTVFIYVLNILSVKNFARKIFAVLLHPRIP